MLLHLTRGLAALLNLCCSSVLVYFWLVFMTRPSRGYKSLGDLLLLGALALISIAGTGAALLLSRRRTARAGVTWHWFAGLGWPLLTCGVLMLTLRDNPHLFPGDWLFLKIMASITLGWAILGLTLNRLLHHDDQKHLSAPTNTSIVSTSDLSTIPAPALSIIPTVSPEAVPLRLGHRG